MPLPTENDTQPQHSVSHYEVRDYSHMFNDGTTVVIEKMPSVNVLNLKDYLRGLDQEEDCQSLIPLRYSIGKWLGHFQNWGSREDVVQKLQGVVRNQELTDKHYKFFSDEFDNTIFDDLNRRGYRLPMHARRTLMLALDLIRENYGALPGKERPFQILNGHFDLRR